MTFRNRLKSLYEASKDLLVDLQETGDDANPETGVEYQKCCNLRLELEKLELELPWIKGD